MPFYRRKAPALGVHRDSLQSHLTLTALRAGFHMPHAEHGTLIDLVPDGQADQFGCHCLPAPKFGLQQSMVQSQKGQALAGIGRLAAGG